MTKNIQKATTTKATKQLTCHNWLKTIKKNENVVKKFEKTLSFSKEMEEIRSIVLNNVGLNNGLSKTEALVVFFQFCRK